MIEYIITIVIIMIVLTVPLFIYSYKEKQLIKEQFKQYNQLLSPEIEKEIRITLCYKYVEGEYVGNIKGCKSGVACGKTLDEFVLDALMAKGAIEMGKSHDKDNNE